VASFDEFYKSLPEDSNKRGEYFEKVFIPWFMRTDPVWSSQVQEVWLWDDYPHRWGKDCGIDLVYEDRQGNHWAVQSKCVSPDHEIPKSDIDSFLSESSDPRIHGRLLIASTDGIGNNAQQVIDRQEKQVVCFLLEHFRHSEVEFPSKPEDLTTGQRKQRRTPKLHQQEAIKKVVKGFQREDRGQLLMACGTGKTLTSLWIKEALHAKRTLVLVPSLGLLSQTLKEWTSTSKEKFNWICVCSDKSVAKQDKTKDNMIERVSGLGVPVTSDPKDIQEFLENKEDGVVFSTYQSSELIAESQNNQATPGFDITFADEAHRCTGKVSSAFACILNEESIRSNKRLFMTATPRVLSKKIKGKASDENIDLACMDDLSRFGTVLHQLNFSEAIENELLSDYRVVIIGIDDPTVEQKIIHRTITNVENELQVDAETLASHIAISKAIKDYNLKRVISFHSRVESAKQFSRDQSLINNWIPEESKIEKNMMCLHVSGNMNVRKRNETINRFSHLGSDEVGLLTNARCLSEGIDIPNLNCIAFIDPRKSQVDVVQALGRVIRRSHGKKYGYILLPVYLGNTNEIEDDILMSRFKDIWSTILALKSQDDALKEVLDDFRVELGKRKTTHNSRKGLTKIIFDLPSSISKSFADSLTTILIKETTDNWLEKYGELKEFRDKNGHTIVPRSHPQLGKWCSRQRTLKNTGKLFKERIQLLNDVEFIWDPREQEWQEKYQELKQYVIKNGNTLVPNEHPTLGSWVATQRQFKKKGMLSQSRIKLLNNIGFVWDKLENEWLQNYEILKEESGKGIKIGIDHPTIGNWGHRQRQKRRLGKLSSEKINLLNKVNFNWYPREEDWEEKYQLLVEFIKENGHALVPSDHPILGTWVGHQRQFAKDNALDPIRKKLLDKIGFIWDVREYTLQENIKHFKEFARDYGHTRVPSDHPILGSWMSNVRTAKKKGKLSGKLIKQLEEIGIIWNLLDQQWLDNYELLKEFKKDFGNLKVPRDYPKIGSWANNQKHNKRAGKLSSKRIELLNEIGFWDA
tara:strand:+ start:789 stop:3887 length:3099 start_codon:yes stop_codon:yes gene_type:complete